MMSCLHIDVCAWFVAVKGGEAMLWLCAGPPPAPVLGVSLPLVPPARESSQLHARCLPKNHWYTATLQHQVGDIVR